jgi:16S rRNA (cytosine1402-N4)-methyltransferase
MGEHIPVMAAEAVSWLDVRPGCVYLDCTTGLGGHSERIASVLGAGGKLVCRDRDAESLAVARERLREFSDRIVFDPGPFSSLPAALHRLRLDRVDGMIADLGLSMHQLQSAERGFSFQLSGPLDMRMDRSVDTPTASDIINFSSERDIVKILEDFGEERRARRIARAILRARPVSSTQRLATIVRQAAPWDQPATLARVFQALRIAVNGELDELASLLAGIPEFIAGGGRAVIISFHSLEDRLIKRRFQELARSGQAEILTPHVVTPSSEEILRNPAARSAKLRALRMTAGTTIRETGRPSEAV